MLEAHLLPWQTSMMSALTEIINRKFTKIVLNQPLKVAKLLGTWSLAHVFYKWQMIHIFLESIFRED